MDNKRSRPELSLSCISYNPFRFTWSSCEQMPTTTQPSTEVQFLKPNWPMSTRVNIAEVQNSRKSSDQRCLDGQTTEQDPCRLVLHCNVPFAREAIGCKGNDIETSSEMILSSRPASGPTNVGYLPSVREKLVRSRTLKSKIIEPDQNTFEHSSTPEVFDDSLTNSNRTFPGCQLPCDFLPTFPNEHKSRRLESYQSRFMSAAPRLLRGKNLKRYGIRRQISSENKMELSPIINSKSSIGIKKSNLATPSENMIKECHTGEAEEQKTQDFSSLSRNTEACKKKTLYHPSRFGMPYSAQSSSCVKTTGNDRQLASDRRSPPWICSYKIKRDRQKKNVTFITQ